MRHELKDYCLCKLDNYIFGKDKVVHPCLLLILFSSIYSLSVDFHFLF